MRYSLAVAAMAVGAFASPMPQGVTEDIAPSASAPAGCSPSFSGQFNIAPFNISSPAKRDLSERQLAGILTLTLADGILTDQAGRTGYIADNFQFQFDEPPQTGAIYTAGFSACGNGSLALGGSAIFYQCLSGSFYNLYDRHWAAQCSPITLQILPTSGGSSSAPAASQATDGQPAVTSAASQLSDGQPQAPSAAPVSQITDGQPQAPSAAPVSQISDGQPQAPSAGPRPITQISDGQIQATSAAAAPISQISDGQIQATSAAAAPISQISDGQIQATSAAAAPISQISDGQIQATSAAAAPISQISDGQIQATTAAPISQISDGQIQATSAAPAPSSSLPVISQISDGQIQVTSFLSSTVAAAASATPSTPLQQSVNAAPVATPAAGQGLFAMAIGVAAGVAFL